MNFSTSYAQLVAVIVLLSILLTSQADAFISNDLILASSDSLVGPGFAYPTIPQPIRSKRGFLKKFGKSVEKSFHSVRDSALPALGAGAGAAAGAAIVG